MRVRLRFSKRGALRFISHLDLAELIHRLARISELPVAHSQGFNPQPRISLSPPLPLGIEGQGELADIYLTERVDLKTCLQELCRVTRVAGLEWNGIQETSLQADSLQQSIEEYGYEIAWRRMGKNTSVLPTDPLELAAAVERFLSSETWPIELLRKGKLQQRDARSFVRGLHSGTPCGFRGGSDSDCQVRQWRHAQSSSYSGESFRSRSGTGRSLASVSSSHPDLKEGRINRETPFARDEKTFSGEGDWAWIR
jgi:radical SAM-linked protein